MTVLLLECWFDTYPATVTTVEQGDRNGPTAMPGGLNVTAPHARTLTLPLHGGLRVSLL